MKPWTLCLSEPSGCPNTEVFVTSTKYWYCKYCIWVFHVGSKCSITITALCIINLLEPRKTQYGNIDYKIHFSAVFSTFFSFQKPSLSSVQIYIFNILYHMSLRVVATFLCITCGVWSKGSGNWPLKIKAVATLNGDHKDWSEASLKSFMLLVFSLLLFLLFFLSFFKKVFWTFESHLCTVQIL